MMTLITISGSKGSGKTTLGKYIEHNLKFTRIPMAKPLKDMLLAMGLTEDHISGDLKEVPTDMLCGRSPRYAMQTLGTEWGRILVGQELWVNMWLRQVALHDDVVCDDVRYPNEMAIVKECNGITVSIRRTGFEGADAHTSELHAASMKTDITIWNDGSIEDMLAEFRDKIKPLMGARHAA